MTVADLLKELERCPRDLEVLITDGWAARGYRGDFQVQPFVDCDGTVYIDIGIGGCLE